MTNKLSKHNRKTYDRILHTAEQIFIRKMGSPSREAQAEAQQALNAAAEFWMYVDEVSKLVAKEALASETMDKVRSVLGDDPVLQTLKSRGKVEQ